MIKKFLLIFLGMMFIIAVTQLITEGGKVQVTWKYFVALCIGALAGTVVALGIMHFTGRKAK